MKHSMQRILWWVVAGLLWAGVWGCNRGPKIYSPAPGEVISLDGAVLIDVRSVEEYEKEHIKDVLFIPHEVIGDMIGERVPALDVPVYVHCAAGVRADMARKTLEEKGYKNVKNLGGMEDAAKKVDRPIVTD